MAPSCKSWRSSRSGSTKYASRIPMISSSRPGCTLTRWSGATSRAAGVAGSAVSVTSGVATRWTGPASPSITTRARNPAATSRTTVTTARTLARRVCAKLERIRKLLEHQAPQTVDARVGSVAEVPVPSARPRQPRIGALARQQVRGRSTTFVRRTTTIMWRTLLICSATDNRSSSSRRRRQVRHGHRRGPILRTCLITRSRNVASLVTGNSRPVTLSSVELVRMVLAPTVRGFQSALSL